ncbi:phage tail tape measure protein [Marinobacterium jannaschii]|uniref:phage tail tape measure protein n=1 Tax=Marinobacterium jannaschii TaxID=64970 RepID=UPI0004885D96|nr:phage tail tape measure protein [Marinobacterium jannaschii]
MSAASYSLTLNASDNISPAFKGAAASADGFTDALKQQQGELRQLKKAQRELGRFSDMKDGLAALKGELATTQDRVKQLSAEKQEARSVVRGLGKDYRSSEKRLSALAEQMEAAEEPSEQLKIEFKQAQQQASELASQLEKARSRVRGIDRSFGAASKRSAALSDELSRGRRALGDLGRSLGDAGVKTDQLADEQKRLEQAVEGANAAIDTQKDRLAQLDKARSRVSAADARMGELQGRVMGAAATAASVALPVHRSIKMEAAMADVSKVVDFEGSEQAEFKSSLQQLAVQVNMSAEDLTQISAAAGQSGVAKDELFDFTQSAARMGVAFDMAAADAGETMAAWRAGMGLTQQQAVELADAVNHVSNNMNATARDISGVLQRQGAVATASGMSETQAASLAGALLSGGASEEVAATTMKNLLGSLTKGEAATSGQKSALSGLGLDAGQLAAGMQIDALGTIQEVFEALADAPVEEQSALISQLFGEESKGGIMPLLKNQQLLQKAFGLTADRTAYLNSAQEEFANRTGTSEHRLGAAAKSLDRLMIVLGDRLLPAVGPLADGVAWAANGVADLAEQFPELASAATVTVAGLTAVKVGMLGWQLAQAKLEQIRSRGALKQAELAARTGDTAARAGLAARAVDRFNRSLARTGSMQPGGVGGEATRKDSGKPAKEKRRRRAGKVGRLGRLVSGGIDAAKGVFANHGGAAAKVGLGAGAMLLPGMASADVLGTAGDVSGGLSDLLGGLGDLGGLGGLAAKAIKPVDWLLQAGNLAGAVGSGDAVDIGGSLGDIIGGTGGMMGGAAAGAAIGSVVPVVGTAIGGAIGAALGGLAGGEGGSMLGEFIGGWFKDDKQESPLQQAQEQVAEQSKQAQPVQDNRQISFSPVIHVTPQPGADTQAIAQAVMQQLKDEFVPIMEGSLSGRLEDSLEVTA